MPERSDPLFLVDFPKKKSEKSQIPRSHLQDETRKKLKVSMDLESPQSLQQKFLRADMRSDAAGSTTTSTIACDISFLSFSCRTRAEDFARSLQIKLKTLGSFDGLRDVVDSSSISLTEPSWKALSLDSHLARRKHMPESSEIKTTVDQFNLTSRMTNSKTAVASEISETERQSSDSHAAENGKNGNPSANTSQDSDIFYDFGIGSPSSPGSPVEGGSSCYTVNTCDDLYCTGCLQNGVSSSSDDFRRHVSSNADNGLESGCIFTSPETMSPNGDMNVLLPVFNIQHSNSADDCTSENSDCSIYYDVETFPSSPHPEVETLLLPELQKVKLSDVSPRPAISNKKGLSPVTTIEDMKQLLSKIGSFDAGDSGSEEEDNMPRIPRIIRCSSLKSGKTPPGTPATKKIVRFADSLGLDLTAVRTFKDEVPKVPKSAFDDLDYPLETFNYCPLSLPTANVPKTCAVNKILVPTFHQPATCPDFFDRIRDNKVLLENAYFSDNFTIKGAVRVLNMDFHKSVYIRYTYDEWKTFTDFQATYVNGSCDGFSDRFEFTVHLKPEMVEIGSRIILAVRFHCKGEQFWDNNCGCDYLFHCVIGSSGPQESFHSSSIYPPLYGNSPDDPWSNHMWF